ncbi:DMT family transporter [Nocardioides sp. YIM 152588]|uniref:DMT family transporter n=1 Tax=Nocardioides sp. YIM 152588 TaxID=3158259 RepID=UPI0032E39186
MAGLLRALVRRPLWLAALALGPVGFTWHALALQHGPIAVVQPVVIVGIVAALPLSTALAGARTAPSDLLAALATVAALAVLLLVTAPEQGAGPTPGTLAPAVALGAGAAVLALTASGRVRRPATRAAVLGASSGLLFGLMAVLVEVVATWLAEPGHGAAGLALQWYPYALVCCGVGGLAVNQVAYRTAGLAASMPVLNVVNCLLTLGFGYLVLGERLTASPASLAVAAVALAVVLRGVWVLSGCDRPRPRRTSSTSSRAVPSAPARAASGC